MQPETLRIDIHFSHSTHDIHDFGLKKSKRTPKNASHSIARGQGRDKAALVASTWFSVVVYRPTTE
jgi:hypothetical protein